METLKRARHFLSFLEPKERVPEAPKQSENNQAPGSRTG